MESSGERSSQRIGNGNKWSLGIFANVKDGTEKQLREGLNELKYWEGANCLISEEAK